MADPYDPDDPGDPGDPGDPAEWVPASSILASSASRRSRDSREYNAPESYRNLDDSLAPIRPPALHHAATVPPPPRRHHSSARRASIADSGSSTPDYDVPDTYVNLGETSIVSPIQNPYEQPIRRFRSLEQVRGQEQEFERDRRRKRRESIAQGLPPEPETPPGTKYSVSRLATQLYTVSYLVFFSILGTLARLGLQALTNYPGTPILFPSIWPNFTGSLIMGYLSEDRMLFREDNPGPGPNGSSSSSADEENPANAAAAAKKTHAALKKTIPLYIGLATGFCGSLTSFSAFIRDAFLGMSNTLPSPTAQHEPRGAGSSFLALVAVLLTTLSLSLSALFLGAHLAIANADWTAPLPRSLRRLLDVVVVPLGWGCWLGAVFLSAFPPNGHTDWRGEVTLALVFAPLGCLARFYVSLALNGKIASFPLGTFVVNMAGTGILAMAWDLAHSGVTTAGVGTSAAAAVGCQILAGVQDGFCGCLTTVSTWVGELAALRRRHAYVYGGASVAGGLVIVIAVMGGVRWSGSYDWGACG